MDAAIPILGLQPLAAADVVSCAANDSIAAGGRQGSEARTDRQSSYAADGRRPAGIAAAAVIAVDHRRAVIAAAAPIAAGMIAIGAPGAAVAAAAAAVPTAGRAAIGARGAA